MKKVSLLFAFAGLFTFAANAQEKATKTPVKVTPVDRPAPAAKPAPVQNTNPHAERVTVAETTPHSDIQPTTKPVEKSPTPQAKRMPVKPKKVNAVAVPVTKAGAAK